MNRDRVASGAAQDPLNYLQRRIVRSTSLSKTVKAHLMVLVRKAKIDGPYSTEDAITKARALFAYGQTLRLEELIDSLRVNDKLYKPTVWALCKMSEDRQRNLARTKDKGRKSAPLRKVPTAATGHVEDDVHEG